MSNNMSKYDSTKEKYGIDSSAFGAFQKKDGDFFDFIRACAAGDDETVAHAATKYYDRTNEIDYAMDRYRLGGGQVQRRMTRNESEGLLSVLADDLAVFMETPGVQARWEQHMAQVEIKKAEEEIVVVSNRIEVTKGDLHTNSQAIQVIDIKIADNTQKSSIIDKNIAALNAEISRLEIDRQNQRSGLFNAIDNYFNPKQLENINQGIEEKKQKVACYTGELVEIKQTGAPLAGSRQMLLSQKTGIEQLISKDTVRLQTLKEIIKLETLQTNKQNPNVAAAPGAKSGAWDAYDAQTGKSKGSSSSSTPDPSSDLDPDPEPGHIAGR